MYSNAFFRDGIVNYSGFHDDIKKAKTCEDLLKITKVRNSFY